MRVVTSCQPIWRARDVCAAVEAVAALGGEIHPTDEGDAIVDDDDLLVVAMQRPFLRVGGTLHLRALRELGQGLRTSRRDGRNSGSGAPAQARR